MRLFQIRPPTEGLALQNESIIALLRFLDGNSQWPIPTGELSIAFLSDAEIAQLHQRFLDDPTSTDVITFPGDSDLDFAGEICVSWQTAVTEARQRNLPVEHELTLYLIHGWLHLAGENDLSENQRLSMRAAEKKLMAAVATAQLWPIVNPKVSSP